MNPSTDDGDFEDFGPAFLPEQRTDADGKVYVHNAPGRACRHKRTGQHRFYHDDGGYEDEFEPGLVVWPNPKPEGWE